MVSRISSINSIHHFSASKPFKGPLKLIPPRPIPSAPGHHTPVRRKGRSGRVFWVFSKPKKNTRKNKNISLRILTPPMETPDPPNDTPGASKQVVLTPHDIPRILRVKKKRQRGLRLDSANGSLLLWGVGWWFGIRIGIYTQVSQSLSFSGIPGIQTTKRPKPTINH